MIVLDTSVLSLAFRRRRGAAAPEPAEVIELRRLVEDDAPLAVPGVVLQELLAGVRSDAQFESLEQALDGFPIVSPSRSTHVRAARIANACRARGIAATTIDCLIAAQCLELSAPLFTTDGDFENMQPHCGLKLHRRGRRAR